jgi:hypothetical protein
VGDLQLQALFVLGLSLIGGTATYLQNVLIQEVERSKARLLLDILLSVLSGFAAWFLCVSQQVDVWYMLFIVLVAGINGAEMLQAFKQKLYTVLSTGTDN